MDQTSSPRCNFGPPVANDAGRKQFTCRKCGRATAWLPAVASKIVRECDPSAVCVHLGEATGRLVKCEEGCKSKLKTFACEIHGECTPQTKGEGVALCRGCADYTAPQTPPKLEYISTRRMTDDTLNLLLPQLPPDLRGIAGVPRSGMPAAAILAMHLQLPLFSIHAGKLIDVGAGTRGRAWSGDPAGKLLIVDDSVHGGGNMKRLRSQFGADALYAAIYPRLQMIGLVDFYARAVPSPHLFQWNLFNGAPATGRDSSIRGGIAFDLDGVICHDPDVPDADEGPGLDRYAAWLVNARPKDLPRLNTVPLILTARLERWRAETEAWLKRWRVNYARLVMHPADKASQRGDVAAWKAGILKSSSCALMIESSEGLAKAIHRLSGKPVIHPESEQVFQ